MSVTAFLTDSTLCIGCKACEVACKEWNGVSEDGLDWSGYSYDNTGAVGASTWRHVKFVEQAPEPGFGGNYGEQMSWTFSSDVCKHCENAGCLEACPTGSIVRTEFGGVYIQPDVCNGCGYCISSCPFGVVERNAKDGRAFKRTPCLSCAAIFVRTIFLPSQRCQPSTSKRRGRRRPLLPAFFSVAHSLHS